MKSLFCISFVAALLLSGCVTRQASTPHTIEAPIPSSSPFSKIRKGMGLRQVMTILGTPTDQRTHATGKAFIPFYFGKDAARTNLYYKGLGQIQFGSGRLGGGPIVNKIVYDPTEDGFKGNFKSGGNDAAINSSQTDTAAIEQRTSFTLGLDRNQFTISDRVDSGVRTDYVVKTKTGKTYRCYVTGAAFRGERIVSDAICSKRNGSANLGQSTGGNSCNALLKAAGKC
jgi:hypothetical protein